MWDHTTYPSTFLTHLYYYAVGFFISLNTDTARLLENSNILLQLIRNLYPRARSLSLLTFTLSSRSSTRTIQKEFLFVRKKNVTITLVAFDPGL